MSVPRHVAVLVTALLIALGAAAPAVAATVAPGTTRGGDVVKTGWWWAANEPPADSGLVAPPQPTPPNAPAGTLPVAAIGGDPEKVSAIEFSLQAQPGALVESFDLVLRETDEPGANANQGMAKIVACPVVEPFWADGTAAAWKAKPDFDCELAQAAGERNAKGIWSFDLTSIAALWLVEGNTSSMSVVLVEDVDAPESFQVAYDGPAAKGIGIKAVTVAAPKDTTAGFGGPAPTEGTAGSATTGGAGPGAPLTGGSSSGGAGISSAPLDAPGVVAPAPDLAAGEVGESVGAPVTAPATGTAQVSATPMAAPPWYAGVPKAGMLLLPLTLGLAYLMMLALGPEAQPSAVTARHGVSRALDRLKRVGAQAVARGVR